MKPAPLIQPPQPQSDRNTKGIYHSLLCLSLSLWFCLFLPVTLSAQASTPVNGGWPAGLRYTVQPGDTLLTASVEMGLDVEQMGCLLHRSFDWGEPLVVGQLLSVPDAPFICHRVESSDTLTSIAARYGVTVAAIAALPWNLTGQEARIRFLRIPLTPGASLSDLAAPPGRMGGEYPLVPTTQLPLPANWPYGSGHFAWPVYGWLTQTFHSGHSAIDIAAWADTPVTAADRGVVIRAGWSDGGYGNFVVIDHKIDYLTLYGHLSEIFVTEGQVVAQGQLIGSVGSTGNSTGPHLHFEIRDFGRRVDPLGLLSR